MLHGYTMCTQPKHFLRVERPPILPSLQLLSFSFPCFMAEGAMSSSERGFSKGVCVCVCLVFVCVCVKPLPTSSSSSSWPNNSPLPEGRLSAILGFTVCYIAYLFSKLSKCCDQECLAVLMVVHLTPIWLELFSLYHQPPLHWPGCRPRRARGR